MITREHESSVVENLISQIKTTTNEHNIGKYDNMRVTN